MVLCPIGYIVYVYSRHLTKYYEQAPKSRYTRFGLRYMYTEVRERCMIGNELQSGYCGNGKFVADHQRAFVIAWSLLHLAEFREGRNRLLYVVCFLTTVVKATVSRSDLPAFNMNT